MTRIDAQSLLTANRSALSNLLDRYDESRVGLSSSTPLMDEDAAILVCLPNAEFKIQLLFLEELNGVLGGNLTMTITADRLQYESLLNPTISSGAGYRCVGQR